MDKKKFDKYIYFGTVGDKKSREKTAFAINNALQNKSVAGIGVDNAESGNFATATEHILSNPTLKELCAENTELAEQITQDILEFINNTNKQLVKTDNPFENEYSLIKECNEIQKSEFTQYFGALSLFLQDTYKNFNLPFYTEQFKSCYFEDEWKNEKKEQKVEKDIELSLINKFEKVFANEKSFFPVWKDSLNLIAKTYKRSEIDCNSYFSRFQKALQQEKHSKNEAFLKVKEAFIVNWKQIRDKRISKEQKENESKVQQDFTLRKSLEKIQHDKFVAVKEHFIENWERLLNEKQIKWELEQIDEQRKIFCNELYRRIEELKKLQEALKPFTTELGRLWDMSSGKWQNVNFDILKRYAELIQKDKSLLELAEMLGKMQQAEKEYEEELFSTIQFTTEWKIEHAYKADLIGVHESDDLSSMLPSEAALLADDTMQSVFFKKFIEKKIQSFEYQTKILSYKEEEIQQKRQKAKENIKGPFIICVDTSGSMHGTPETVTKTLSFAILKIAIRENRKCYLISFSTGIETIELADLKNSLVELIAFLSMSFNGGTDATPAIQEALRMLKTNEYKKADVIMVSDFVMPEFESSLQKQIKSAKANNTKFHSLVIGDSVNPAIMKDFDNNWYYNPYNNEGFLTLLTNLKDL